MSILSLVNKQFNKVFRDDCDPHELYEERDYHPDLEGLRGFSKKLEGGSHDEKEKENEL